MLGDPDLRPKWWRDALASHALSPKIAAYYEAAWAKAVAAGEPDR